MILEWNEGREGVAGAQDPVRYRILRGAEAKLTPDGGGWRLTGDLADVRACLAVVVGFISGSRSTSLRDLPLQAPSKKGSRATSRKRGVRAGIAPPRIPARDACGDGIGRGGSGKPPGIPPVSARFSLPGTPGDPGPPGGDIA